MSIHQYNPNKRPDSEFIDGHLSLLCEGNKCRLLDGRRTPGYIDKVDFESGMFTWKISDFEDKGNHWILPFEHITKYQFEKNSKHVNEEELKEIHSIIKQVDQLLEIQISEEKSIETEEKIEQLKYKAMDWLQDKSSFLISKEQLDFNSNTGSEKLSMDLLAYMKEHDLEVQEALTADIIVLNPNSGEWIKGMAIVLAEMGIVSYSGKATRTKDVFSGPGQKKLRQKYILHRLAFIRALFSLLDIRTVPLYRGMCSELDWRENKKTFMSFSFNHSVAKSFSGFDEINQFKNAYFIKATVEVEKLFMTYLETKQMNERYKEAEALTFNSIKITI